MLPKVEDVQSRAIDRAGTARGLAEAAALPAWLPDAARLYLRHTEQGVSLRELARKTGVHPSTVLRQVRRYETRRDDPVIDEALCALGSGRAGPDGAQDGCRTVTIDPPRPACGVDDPTMEAEGRRILRRLSEPGTVLAIALDLEKAAVLRSFPDGRTVRMAVVDRAVAQAFALKDWIACRKPGRIATYEITPAGRAAVKRMEAAANRGLADGSRMFFGAEATEDRLDADTRPRATATESPVAVLARRRDKDGRAFLDADLVASAERLREDFELARIGVPPGQGWEEMLASGVPGGTRRAAGDTPRTARERVAAALADLGPGLGDVVLRCCCYLEGVETTEQRMGWSARSGKIVLRIALQRLKAHYAETYGKYAPLIG